MNGLWDGSTTERIGARSLGPLLAATTLVILTAAWQDVIFVPASTHVDQEGQCATIGTSDGSCDNDAIADASQSSSAGPRLVAVHWHHHHHVPQRPTTRRFDAADPARRLLVTEQPPAGRDVAPRPPTIAARALCHPMRL